MGHPLPPAFLLLLGDAGVQLFVEVRRNGRGRPMVERGPNRLLAVGKLPAFRAFNQVALQDGLSWRIQGARTVSDDPVRIVLLASHKIKSSLQAMCASRPRNVS